MILEHLRVSGLRNIDEIELDPAPDVNWIIGPNGAGKTSLLEAVFLLGRGRSFRGTKHGPLQSRGRGGLEVSATVDFRRRGGQKRTIHFAQHGRETRLIENGQRVPGFHSLRDRLQVRLIAENAQKLIEGGPGTRRLFLDWNLFHVEQDYVRTLVDFRRVQNQRNAWLRAGGKGHAAWDPIYVTLSQQIDRARRSLVEHLDDFLQRSAHIRESLRSTCRLHYRRGWPDNTDLSALLNANRTADVARGYTHYGPSRGDFAVRLQHGAGLPSRGQTKLLVFYLQLGAQEFTDGLGGRRAIWLLDDLSAELDRPAARLILTELRATRDQIFVTTVGDRRTPEDHFPIRGGALFHVEQGRLAPPTCGHSAVK